jgi:hypothetical protein
MLVGNPEADERILNSLLKKQYARALTGFSSFRTWSSYVGLVNMVMNLWAS